MTSGLSVGYRVCCVNGCYIVVRLWVMRLVVFVMVIRVLDGIYLVVIGFFVIDFG